MAQFRQRLGPLADHLGQLAVVANHIGRNAFGARLFAAPVAQGVEQRPVVLGQGVPPGFVALPPALRFWHRHTNGCWPLRPVAHHQRQIGHGAFDKKMVADRFDLLVGEEILHRLVVEALGDGVKRQGKQLKPHHTPLTPASVGAQLPGQG